MFISFSAWVIVHSCDKHSGMRHFGSVLSWDFPRSVPAEANADQAFVPLRERAQRLRALRKNVLSTTARADLKGCPVCLGVSALARRFDVFHRDFLTHFPAKPLGAISGRRRCPKALRRSWLKLLILQFLAFGHHNSLSHPLPQSCRPRPSLPPNQLCQSNAPKAS